MPFDDMTAQGDHAYLGDGIADELLHRLSQSKDLRVIARTSSFALRDAGLDIPAIAVQLGVRYVLQGSLRETGGAIRITVQLVDAHEMPRSGPKPTSGRRTMPSRCRGLSPTP